MQPARTMGRRTRASLRPTRLCFVCAAAVLVAGCGSSGHKASTTETGATSSTAPAPSATATGIRSRLLVSNELPGFASGSVSVYTTAQEWLSSPNNQQSAAQAAAEKAMLTREGFRAGATENLTGSSTAGGLSLVEQFRSAAAAQHALAFYASGFKAPSSTAGAYAPFKVRGIPGAVGFSVGGVSGGINIAFTQGDSYYLVGREGGSATAIAGLKTAALRLYNRLRG
jgi:hypothetical protein